MELNITNCKKKKKIEYKNLNIIKVALILHKLRVQYFQIEQLLINKKSINLDNLNFIIHTNLTETFGCLSVFVFIIVSYIIKRSSIALCAFVTLFLITFELTGHFQMDLTEQMTQR